jgi:hypothetical protein
MSAFHPFLPLENFASSNRHWSKSRDVGRVSRRGLVRCSRAGRYSLALRAATTARRAAAATLGISCYFKPFAMFRCAVTVGTSPLAKSFRAGVSPEAA